MRGMRIPYRILFGKHDGKRPCGTPRRIWDVNIIKEFKEIG
jgi:hypothetical protein